MSDRQEMINDVISYSIYNTLAKQDGAVGSAARKQLRALKWKTFWSYWPLYAIFSVWVVFMGALFLFA